MLSQVPVYDFTQAISPRSTVRSLASEATRSLFGAFRDFVKAPGTHELAPRQLIPGRPGLRTEDE